MYSDNEFRVGVFDLLGKLRNGVKRISCGGDCSESDDGEEANGEADRVGSKNENDVIFGDA